MATGHVILGAPRITKGTAPNVVVALWDEGTETAMVARDSLEVGYRAAAQWEEYGKDGIEGSYRER